jgi:hypothetical protein
MTEEKRLLVVAGAPAPNADAVPALIRELLAAASEVLVITPVLPGRLEWLVSDVDEARQEADERLGTVLGHMDEAGVRARGDVGDESPLTAFEDAVERFRPDHILIAMRPAAGAGWQEPGLVEQVRRRFGLPVTAFDLPG